MLCLIMCMIPVMAFAVDSEDLLVYRQALLGLNDILK